MPGAPFEDLCILVVDDSKADRETLRRVLRGLGVGRIRTAPNGARALRIASRMPFDLALCDPGGDAATGLETIACLRQHAAPSGRNLPVLVLTAQRGSEIVERARHEGVAGYILKPASAATLRARIEQLIDHGTAKADDR